MDLHIIPGAKAEDVAKAHVKDLYCQDEFGCRAITYWFDECKGKAFCLIEAPDEASVTELHRKAHGLIPNQVTPVDPILVESFLGRLTDPEDIIENGDPQLRVFEDSALRYLLYIKIPDFVLMASRNSGEEAKELEDHLYTIMRDLASRYNGRKALLKDGEIYYSFKDLDEALSCALAIQSSSREISPLFGLKMAVNSGEPLTQKDGFFEEAAGVLRALAYQNTSGGIMLASELLRENKVKMAGYYKEYPDMLNTIEPDQEKFLAALIRITEQYYMNPNLDVGFLASRLAYSNSKLYRLCRQATGVSPNRFIREYRLLKAKGLMTSNTDSISEIGFNCGFNTPSYFTRCFQQFYGMNPMEYKSAVLV